MQIQMCMVLCPKFYDFHSERIFAKRCFKESYVEFSECSIVKIPV